MEENVALDSSKQKKFVKTIKKIIKKSATEKSDVISGSQEVKNVKKAKRKRPERGLVYLSHIPHGFYEHEMTQYFKQFGLVTNVRVIRSKRTGNSKGFAFVEFKEPTVAEIVAETMNNYLMGKRLIKAALIPPEKQKPNAMRKHWSRVRNPGAEARLKNKKAYNENKDEQGELKRAKKIVTNLNKTKTKLSELGIDYNFFTPVDVPDALVSLIENKKETEKQSIEKKKDTKTVVSSNKGKKNKEVEENTKKIVQEKISKTQSKQKEPKKVDKNVQKNKENKLKQAGVKPAEDFIKVQEESDDSDSSVDFDSDEYEKMLSDDDSDADSNDENDSDAESNADDEENGSESHDEIDTESEEEESPPPPKKMKGKLGKKAQIQTRSKKPKFEKQTQQPMKKQFKKKK